MQLVRRLAPFFDPRYCARGVDYFRSGGAQVRARRWGRWRLVVRGTIPYEVVLPDAEGSACEPPGSCSCPAFEKFGPCKHLWASVLEVELLLRARELLGEDRDVFRFDRKGRVTGWRDAETADRCREELGPDLLAAVTDELGYGGDGEDEEFDEYDLYDEEGMEEDEEDGGYDDLEDEDLVKDLERLQTELHARAVAELLAQLQEGPPPAARPEPDQHRVPATVVGPNEGLEPLVLGELAPRRMVVLLRRHDGDPRRPAMDVVVLVRSLRRDGTYGGWRAAPADRALRGDLRATDRRLLDLVAAAGEAGRGDPRKGVFAVPAPLLGPVVRELCAARAVAAGDPEDLLGSHDDPARWLELDEGPPFRLEVRHESAGGNALVRAVLRRGEEEIAAGDVRAIVPGWALTDTRLLPVEPRDVTPAVVELCERGPQATGDADDALALLEELAVATPPGALRSEVWPVEPAAERAAVLECQALGAGEWIGADLAFEYDGRRVPALAPARHLVVDRDPPRLVAREEAFEERARARLAELGCVPAVEPGAPCMLRVPGTSFVEAVQALLAEGWIVEAQGRRVRRTRVGEVRVTSGEDWFEVRAAVEVDGEPVPVPELLARRKEQTPLEGRMVRLGDGSFGLLPEKWLEAWAPVAAMGKADGEALRLPRARGWVIDMLLERRAQDRLRADPGFRAYRRKLASFEAVRPREEPRGFRGELRPYQREGLGWLRFLVDLGLGGCLADDMGLGKTVQVLALLASLPRRVRRPSLVVAPRSVVHNWAAEAARFTPGLSVHEHLGPARWEGREAGAADAFADVDLVLTTYGTLRRDVAELAEVSFGLLVLDEAQAIKNASSQTSKAARALRGVHRLALTGTPVENHLGELWALFEFLNPGMLGASSTFERLLAEGRKDGAQEGLAGDDLRRALRPFVLRRTKERVLDDLPPKTEQVLHVDLREPERRAYDELCAFYRDRLLRRADEEGLAKMKVHVLEALLRLRQAACHRGLIDPAQRTADSAKLETLLEMLEEATETGHKALVFSQFTKLLGIVRERLDARGVAHAYLDGRTRKREERIARFQQDPDCRVFLISLKAGGLGLNLTAADYVFLLDPWWNPAVERQATDRAHRIGQTRPVMAYRLIARDTVEEKVLALQQRKRELAEALFGDGDSVLRDLTREDLEMLLGG